LAEPARPDILGNTTGVALLEDTTAGIAIGYHFEQGSGTPYDSKEFYLSIPYGVTYSASMSKYRILEYKDLLLGKLIIDGTDEVPMDGESQCLRLQEIFWRDLRLLKVRLEPSRIANYSSGKGGVLGEAVFRIVFSGQADTGDIPENPVSTPFETLYKMVLLNEEHSLERRGRIPEFGREEAPTGYQKMPDGSPSMRFEISEQGIYRLTREELESHGLSWESCQNISLWKKGARIPCSVRRADSTQGLAEDGILFYAPTPGDEFNPRDSYWLGSDPLGMCLMDSADPLPTSGKVLEVTSFRETLEFREQKAFPKEGHPSPRWYWQGISLSRGGTIRVPFSVPGIDETQHVTSPISLTITLYNASGDDVKVQIKAPGDVQSDFSVARYSEHIASVTLDFSTALLSEPFLTISAEASAVGLAEKGHLYLESVKVDYVRRLDLHNGRVLVKLDRVEPEIVRRLIVRGLPDIGRHVEVFDIISSASPLCMTRGLTHSATQTYLDVDFRAHRILIQNANSVPPPEDLRRDTPSNLRDSNVQCDYIFLSHHAFLNALEPLKAHRESQGLKVLLVDVQDVYDEFSHGMKSIESIRLFLRHALTYWQSPIPAYVLLVGDANWDPWDRRGLGTPDYLPTYLSERRPYTPAEDNWYFLVNGDSGFEHMMWGRLAARSEDDVRAVIEKIKTNDLNAPLGWWRSKVLMVCDDGFEKEMEKSAESVADAGAICVRAFQTDYPYVTNMRLKDNGLKVKFCTAATVEILKQINEGVLAYYYMGHGGANVMSAERIFLGGARGDSDVLKLENAPRFPFFFSMSCLTGLYTFDDPAPGVSIAEDWQTRSNRGGISAYCPSGKGGTSDHMVLAECLNESLMRDRLSTFGEVFAAAKLRFLHRRRSSMLNNQYIFFGDPASRPVWPSVPVAISPAMIARSIHETTTEFVVCKIHDERLSRAKAELKLTTLSGEILWRHGPVSLTSGELAVNVPLKPGQEVDGQLSCYVWDDEQRVDAIGSVRVKVTLPNLRLSSLNVSTLSSEDGIVTDVKVENISTVPVIAPVTLLWRCNAMEERAIIPPLDVGAVHSVTAEFHILDALCDVDVILDPDELLQESKREDNRISKKHFFSRADSSRKAEVRISQEDIRYQSKRIASSQQGVESVTGEIKTVLWNPGGQDADGLRIILVDEDSGRTLYEERRVRVPAGGNLEVSAPCPFDVRNVRVDVFGPVLSRPAVHKGKESSN